MRFDKKVQAFALVGLFSVAGSAAAQGYANNVNGYVGVGIGNSNLELKDGGERIDSLGTTGFKLFGGVNLNEYFGIEAQYVDFGDFEMDVFGESFDAELTGWGLAVTGAYPVTDSFALTGRLGALRWDYDDNFGDDDGTDAHYGIGARIDVTERFSLRADWDFYPIEVQGTDLDTDVISVSGQFNF